MFKLYGYSQAINPSCEHSTFCENIPHYPTDLVNIALEKNPHLRYLSYDEQLDQSTRHEGEPDEEALCMSTEQVVFPKYGLTKNKQWKYIVNHENLRQNVRIEICSEEDKPCKIIDGFAAGYVTSCKQKYIYRQLFAMGPNNTIDRESFRFPVSCCCHIEFQGDRFLRNLASED
ncbi:spaetzle domain-containing protein isoform X2 [Augochlora pura]